MEPSQLFFTAHIPFTTTLIKLPHFFMVRQKNAFITDRFEVRIYCERFNLTKLSNEGFDSVWDFYFSYDKKLVEIFKQRNISGKYEHTNDDTYVKSLHC